MAVFKITSKSGLTDSELNAVQAMLDAVNEKKQTMLVSVDQIIDAAHEIEEQLESELVKKKNRRGCRATFTHSSDKITPTLKLFFKRVHDGWRLTKVKRSYAYRSGSSVITIKMTEQAVDDHIRSSLIDIE